MATQGPVGVGDAFPGLSRTRGPSLGAPRRPQAPRERLGGLFFLAFFFSAAVRRAPRVRVLVKRRPHSHVVPAAMSGISVGLNKGFVITKHTPAARNVVNKAKASKRSKFVKDVVREVAGFAPYERRLIDLCRNNLDKRALRLAKRKLGTHTRAKRKREEMSGIAFRLRQEAAKKAAAERAALRAEEEAKAAHK